MKIDDMLYGGRIRSNSEHREKQFRQMLALPRAMGDDDFTIADDFRNELDMGEPVDKVEQAMVDELTACYGPSAYWPILAREFLHNTTLRTLT